MTKEINSKKIIYQCNRIEIIPFCGFWKTFLNRSIVNNGKKVKATKRYQQRLFYYSF